jgi:hypothetical protein
MPKALAPSLVVLVAAAAAGGCGGATKTVTVNHSTAPLSQPGTASSASPTTSSATSAAPQEFSGNGGKNLGAVQVEQEATLEWTNDGAYFGIYTDKSVPVNSYGHSGSTVLEAGSYSRFYVNALGNWTIKIVPK